MKTTVDFSLFCNSFSDAYNNNFSFEGKRALFDYLSMVERDTKEELELDIVALCCEYTEYDSAWDAMYAYQPDDMPVEGEPGDDLVAIQIKNEAAAANWLGERTALIEVPGKGVIIQNF